MQVDIIPIGNSKGIRIPKGLLDQCGFGGSADIAVEDGCLVVRPTRERRAGWADAFHLMAERGDDELLATPPPAFDDEEWTW